MDNRYLRLSSEESYWIKSNLRFSEEKFNNILRSIRSYKLLRAKEIVLKNKLKVAFTSLKGKVNLMETTFPEEERKDMSYQILQKENQSRNKFSQNKNASFPVHPIHPNLEPRKSQNEELEEIRRKLERLKM